MVSISVPTPSDRTPWRRVLDILERAIVLALFAGFFWRNYDAIVEQGRWFNAILLASEALVVLFILLRRPGVKVTERPGDWVLAFAATIGPLLVSASPSGRPLIPVGSGVAILMLGISLQIWSKLTLRRSFGIVPANRGVKVSGPYRFVRHPMYLSYVTTQIGFLLLTPDAWNLSVYALSFAAQLARLLAEERLLSLDPAYLAFRAETRFRLLPGVF